MATYREIAASEVDADSPFTTTLMEALDGNTTAIAEGAIGAPKMAIKTFSGSAGSGSVDITGLGTFSGVRIDIHFGNSNGGLARDVEMALSNNGATFGTAVNLRSVPASGTGSITMAVDFATGDYEGAFHDNTAGQVSGTVSGSSLAVVTVRITADTDVTIGVFAQPNGGESSS